MTTRLCRPERRNPKLVLAWRPDAPGRRKCPSVPLKRTRQLAPYEPGAVRIQCSAWSFSMQPGCHPAKARKFLQRNNSRLLPVTVIAPTWCVSGRLGASVAGDRTTHVRQIRSLHGSGLSHGRCMGCWTAARPRCAALSRWYKPKALGAVPARLAERVAST